MAMEVGGPRCAKWTLYLTNILIIILACVTLGVGIWMSSDISGFQSSMTRDLDPSGMATAAVQRTVYNGVGSIQTVANILITSGVFALLIGLLGIWAAYRDSKSLLLAYAVILIIIVLLELGAGIAWAVQKPKIVNGFAAAFDAAIPYYDLVQTTTDSSSRIVVVPNQGYNNRTVVPTALINMVQTYVGCCGGERGYMDFRTSPYWAKAGGVAPVYCCRLSNIRQLTLADPNCAIMRTPENSYMNTGCTVKVTSWIYRNSGSIVGVAVGIGLINVLGIIAAFYQYHCLSQGYREF